MRQIVAIALFTFMVVCNANATTNDDIQQGIFDSYLKLAGEGDVVAQYVVAQRYENGKGTEKNLDKAYYWYEKAADQRYPLALVKLETQKKLQAQAAEPAPAAKPVESPAPTRAPKVAQVKTEPAKKPVAPPQEPVKPVAPPPEPVAKPKAKPIMAAVQPESPPAHVSKPKPAAPAVQEVAVVKQEVITPTPMVVAKAPVYEEPPMPSINVIPALLSGKWKRNQQDVEFLPSSRASCLQSSNVEAVCFSQELTRNLENAGLTYNVKSIISGINNKEARFNLRMVYNVVHIAGKPFAQPNGMTSEISDMLVKTGWQEPGVSMECRMRDERSLTCARSDNKMTFQFVRE